MNKSKMTALLALSLASCGGPSSTQNTPPDAKRAALLAGFGPAVMLPMYRRVDTGARTLLDATTAYAEARELGSADLAERRLAAQTAWRDSMSAWQGAEVLQVGPAGSPIVMAAGRSLRDEIYSWPTSNRCRVDQELVEGKFSAPDFFDTELVNVYGLDALEYLLFTTGAENECPASVPINRDGTWAALSEDEIELRRAQYAEGVAGNIALRASELLTAWEPEGEDFSGALERAGQDGSDYESADAAINQIFAAMFYLDLEVKDRKLAAPLDLHDLCAVPSCTDLLESRLSDHSRENILANLEAFRLAYKGGEATTDVGFDDLLIEAGEAELASSFEASLDGALAAVSGMNGSMSETIESEPTRAQELYDAIKRVTDVFKSNFAGALELELPKEGASDID